MTTERTFSSTHVYSLAFWLVGLTLILFRMIYGWNTGSLGLFFAGIGGVLNIRGFIHHMEWRERNAFELGRDAERIRSIR